MPPGVADCRELRVEVLREQRDVIAARIERGQLELHHGEPIVEFFAKSSGVGAGG